MKDFVVGTFSIVNISADCSRAALILFASDAFIYFNLNEYTTEVGLRNALDQIQLSNFRKNKVRRGTNTPAVLDLLRVASQDGSLGLSEDKIHIALVITDGRPNLKHINKNIDQIVAYQRTRRAGILLHGAKVFDQIYAIGIEGKHPIGDTLGFIADPRSLAFTIAGFNESLFNQVGEEIAREFCNPCTGFACPNGSICRVCEETRMPYCEYSCSINNGGCPEGATCRETPIMCPPRQCCSSVNVTCEVCEVNADLVYVLDVSISIGDDANFQEVTSFVGGLGQVFDIGLNDNLAGVILFARHANIEFDVQEHTSAADFATAVTNIIYSDIPRLNRTGTNIPEALDLLRTAGRRGGALRFRDDPNIPKIAVFLTDGRPNTRHLTGNSKQQDVINTENAAARLHESGIYDQIYGIGIQGTKEINFVELGFIASDPGLVFVIDDFDEQLFQELRRNLSVSICRRQECRVEGQVYLQFAPPPECQPTCSNPNSPCLPFGPGCVCPEGTVIDQIKNRCVPLAECTCPPQCSHQFCGSPLVQNSATLIPCMRGPPPYTGANCTDDCQLTYCQACYYYPRPLLPPPGCVYKNVRKGCFCCLREWARCVENRNRRDNRCTGNCQTRERFRCYDYHLCL